MWELDYEESWALKNWCFWTVVLEKTLENPLDCKEIQPVHSDGDQPWDFFGRNDAKAETPALGPPHVKSWLIGKDSDAGRDWGQEEKGTTEDEMAGWHHRLDRHESEWTPGVGDGQGGLACCDSWGRKELVTTKWLNWTDGCICICVYSVTLFIVVINLCLYVGLLQFCGVFLFFFFSLSLIILIFLNLLYFFYVYSFVCLSYYSFPLAVNLFFLQLIFNVYKSSSTSV